MTARIRSAKSWTRRRSWLPRASAVRSSARLARLVLQLSSAGGDFAGAALQFGEFDEPGLVEVDEAAPFGVGGVDLAVQPGQFGGEQFVVGDRGGQRDGLFAGQQHVRAG